MSKTDTTARKRTYIFCEDHLPMMVMVMIANIRTWPVKMATAHMHTTRDRTTL